MNRIVCMPGEMLPDELDTETTYFSLYSRLKNREEVGSVAASLKIKVKRAGIQVDENAWDFVSFALAVAAADKAIARNCSEDGWTRQISLVTAVHRPDAWRKLAAELSAMLKFLTGDYWVLDFVLDNTQLPSGKSKEVSKNDCVALLSGGMDSLVGAIDLVADGYNPLFVSHTVRGNLPQQQTFARTITGGELPYSWNSAIYPPKGHPKEESTRARSIVFFAFAALAACRLARNADGKRKIVVAENGFISLNVAMNPSRIGSLSTKTTHPTYMDMLRSIWDKLGLNIDIEMPYRFKTKGEMLLECSNQTLLKQLIDASTSCGRFGHYKLMHCGRCVPCVVRRAAYLRAGLVDGTTYFYANIKNAGLGAHPNDIGAMAMRCVESHQQGFDAKILSAFTFAPRQERPLYLDVYKRGLAEIEALLKAHQII